MTTKIGYFTASTVATSAEETEVARIESVINPDYSYRVCSAIGDTEYSSGDEEFDLVAGEIPTAYSGDTVTYIEDAAYPSVFGIYCQAATVVAASTLTLIPITTVGTNALNMVATQLAADATSIAWASDDEAVATVADAVITGVGAGDCTITATYTFATGKTKTATFDVTVTAS